MNEGAKGGDMTQETFLALADKAGLWYPMGGSPDALHGRARLVEFARLIEAAERERCARLCDKESAFLNDDAFAAQGASLCADAIRMTPNEALERR